MDHQQLAGAKVRLGGVLMNSPERRRICLQRRTATLSLSLSLIIVLSLSLTKVAPAPPATSEGLIEASTFPLAVCALPTDDFLLFPFAAAAFATADIATAAAVAFGRRLGIEALRSQQLPQE